MSNGSTPRRHRPGWTVLLGSLLVALGGSVLTTSAAPVSSGVRPVYVPITPCRLLDTRPAPDNVGPRATAVGAGEVLFSQGRGTVGRCTLPTDAVALAMNVAIISPTADSFLTVYPGDADRPLAANLNWVAGQAPTPNAVTTKLSADGALAFYNLAGSVHLAVDVQGYYVDSNFDDRYYTEAESDAKYATQAQAATAQSQLNGLSTQVTGLAADLADLQDGLVRSVTHIEGSLSLNPMFPTSIGSFTTSAAGEIFIDASVSITSTCPTSPRYYVLKIDGTTATPTATPANTGSEVSIRLAGWIGATLPAGAHTVEVAVSCNGGAASAMSVPMFGPFSIVVLP